MYLLNCLGRTSVNTFKYSLTALIASLALSATAKAETAPFELKITGPNVDVSKKLELSDVGEDKTKINFEFKDKNGKPYSFNLNYKALPKNRSYPTNLDITLKDGAGQKRGYLFFAINNVAFLKQMGEFGLIVDVDGTPFDLKFIFDANKKGNLKVANLGNERLVSDTLFPKKGFQMIRPMLLPETSKGVRSQTYALDSHPYEMNYTLIDNKKTGGVQFQYNLNKKQEGKIHLLERVYFNADSLETLRQGMFAGKYFDAKDGAFKLVFYPAMGQTAPPQK